MVGGEGVADTTKGHGGESVDACLSTLIWLRWQNNMAVHFPYSDIREQFFFCDYHFGVLTVYCIYKTADTTCPSAVIIIH